MEVTADATKSSFAASGSPVSVTAAGESQGTDVPGDPLGLSPGPATC